MKTKKDKPSKKVGKKTIRAFFYYMKRFEEAWKEMAKK